MNFLVRTYCGRCVVRPDISFNRDSGDYFVPDDVSSIGFSPVVVAHLVKTGKMVGRQFAARYYDAVTFGVLLYPDVDFGKGRRDFCLGASSCFDNTTVIPRPLFAIPDIPDDGCCSLGNGIGEIWRMEASGYKDKVEAAIVDCSNHSLVRKGDYVLAELAEIRSLCRRENGDSRLSICVCGKITADIEIKF